MYLQLSGRDELGQRFPRTRGDVPLAHAGLRRGQRLPPHARGCTECALCNPTLPRASPARAGMYPFLALPSSAPTRFPRTRGDVPVPRRADRPLAPLPPHARGCTGAPGRGRGRYSASPARAGMYPSSASPTPKSFRFPRTRGDVPPTLTASPHTFPLPPHARGCTPDDAWVDGGKRASPARAGMYRRRGSPRGLRTSFPRTRGDVPARWRITRRPGKLPPHARGCTLPGFGLETRPVASPARAGMYPASAGPGTGSRGFPRTRGDVPSPRVIYATTRRLPPHARGCTRLRAFGAPVRLASPARAGMYPCNTGPPIVGRSFPRTRGDVPSRPYARRRRPVLPPHARGCTRLGIGVVGDGPASPARAGMYPSTAPIARGRPGFPRTRGDVPNAGSIPSGAVPLPPHARGCTEHRAAARRRFQASPARAGMYPRKTRRAAEGDGFPRTRGDVPATRSYRVAAIRLPPHARGCTPSRPPRSAGWPASPARAGMYPRPGRGPPGGRRFPRTRGDVPMSERKQTPAKALPPHARGCTPASTPATSWTSASPARAGMYPHAPGSSAPAPSFPRTRGDVPRGFRTIRGVGKLPPHARGCTD